MNLCSFLHFNKSCPVCNEPLTLYAQIIDGPLWKARKVSDSIYHFNQFACKNEHSLSDDDFFCVTDLDKFFEIDFSNTNIYQKSKAWSFFFIYLCNEDAIEDITNTDYSINPYSACYVRSSPILEFKQMANKDWRLGLVDESQDFEVARDEVFIFKSQQNNDSKEKIYILNFDYEEKKTVLRYCSVSPEEKKDHNFEPTMFKKELPLMNVRPNFDISQRDKLISRFDSWILMS